MKKIRTLKIVLVISGKKGNIFSIKFDDEEKNEFMNFWNKFDDKQDDPMAGEFKIVKDKLSSMLENYQIREHFFDFYDNGIIKLNGPEFIRLYGIYISKNEVLLSNGGWKKGSGQIEKKAFQHQGNLTRENNILESLKPQLMEALKQTQSQKLQDIVDNPVINKFEVQYEDFDECN